MDVPQPTLHRTIEVASRDFVEGGVIPDPFTCHGPGASPAFTWSGVPADATTVAVVVSDPDAPSGTFLHWLVTGLPAADGGFPAGATVAGAREWANSGRTTGWYPPCPPSGTHRYVFAVFALDAHVEAGSSQEALQAIDAHVVAWGTLTGLVRAR